jgi:hypothetical protein
MTAKDPYVPDHDKMPPLWFKILGPVLVLIVATAVQILHWFVIYTPRSWHPGLSAKNDALEAYHKKKGRL